MILSDKDLKQRLVQNTEDMRQYRDWWKRGLWDTIANRIVIDPFDEIFLGPCCYGLSVGDEYVSLRDPFEVKKLEKGKHITINPSETVLILTKEYIALPRNVLSMVVPRATWIFEGVSLSATRIDPTWYGKLLVGVTNLAKNPVALDYGEEFCTTYFMETTEVTKALTRETHHSLGREQIGTISFAHARQQIPLSPDKVTREHISKVVELYGWPWDVMAGALHLTKTEIGEWIEKEVTSDIVDMATNAAVNRAFDELTTQYRESNKWNRNLAISVISTLAVIGAAILGAAVTYIITQLT